MKTTLAVKVILLLPLALFVDYIIMVLVGSAACIAGCGNDFYCGPYCLVGKIILGISAVVVLFLTFPEIKALFKSGKHGSPIEK